MWLIILKVFLFSFFDAMSFKNGLVICFVIFFKTDFWFKHQFFSGTFESIILQYLNKFLLFCWIYFIPTFTSSFASFSGYINIFLKYPIFLKKLLLFGFLFSSFEYFWFSKCCCLSPSLRNFTGPLSSFSSSRSVFSALRTFNLLVVDDLLLLPLPVF